MPAGGQISPGPTPPPPGGIERNQSTYGTVNGFTALRQDLPIISPTVRRGNLAIRAPTGPAQFPAARRARA